LKAKGIVLCAKGRGRHGGSGAQADGAQGMGTPRSMWELTAHDIGPDQTTHQSFHAPSRKNKLDNRENEK